MDLKEEALSIAANVAKLPELLRQRRKFIRQWSVDGGTGL